MIARLSISIVTGTVVTFVLLWIMQILIATGKEALTDRPEFRMVDFVRVKQESTVEQKRPKPKKPPEPEQEPPDVPPPQMDNMDTAQSVSVQRLAVSTDVSIGGIGGFENVDGEYLPIVKVAPIYPRRAQSRGLSGYCILNFTVTRLGTVADISVEECTSSLFERASVNAAAKFKYKPRVVDGEPIDVPGVRHKITFEIEN